MYCEYVLVIVLTYIKYTNIYYLWNKRTEWKWTQAFSTKTL